VQAEVAANFWISCSVAEDSSSTELEGQWLAGQSSSCLTSADWDDDDVCYAFSSHSFIHTEVWITLAHAEDHEYMQNILAHPDGVM